MSRVHPVAILSALFCIACSLSMFVCEMIGDQIVDAYSRRGRVMALYVATMVSFCCPQLVDVRDESMLSVFFALTQVLFMCAVYVCCVSRLTPRILLLLRVVSGVLLIVSESWLLCSWGSGVARESCVLVGLICRLFCCVQECSLFKYGCSLSCAVLMFGCVAVTVMSSA